MDMQNAKYAIYAEEDTKPKKRVLMRAFEDWEKEDVARVAEKLYSDMESGELLGHIKEANCPVVPNHLVLTDFNREIELRNKDDLRYIAFFLDNENFRSIDDIKKDIEFWDEMGGIIDQIAYEMYKEDWIQAHFADRMKNYRAFLNQCMDDFEGTGETIYKDDDGDADYNAYLNDFGFEGTGGACYVSPEEFMANEFCDREYMHELLKDDKLIAWYDKVIDEYERNKEKDYEDTYEDR